MPYQLPTTFSPEIFRAYDIRGTVEDQLTENHVYAIGLALGSRAQDQNISVLAVARDGRLSSPALSKALIAGILESGCDVIDIGAVPTPLLYFATHHLADSGVMLTGSHNPPSHNGIKVMFNRQSLREEQITDLYDCITNRDFKQGQGRLSQASIVNDYIDKVSQSVQLNKKLKIVIDCGSGIAGAVAPDLFKQLGCEVIELFCEVDGNFPHHHPDPSIPENLETLSQVVKETSADIGLAFDGDGDRLGMVTEQGDMIFPDRQLMLYATDTLNAHPGATIIYDVKCTRLLDDVIKQKGGVPLMWKTGHSLIEKKLYDTKAKLAGEMSGHMFFNDRWFGFDDGLYTAARLLEIVSNTHDSVSEIFQAFPNAISTPELKVAVPDNEKFAVIERLIEKLSDGNANKITIDGLRIEYPDSWGLVRCSNTTPNLILRFEADTQEALTKIQNTFYDALEAIGVKS